MTDQIFELITLNDENYKVLGSNSESSKMNYGVDFDLYEIIYKNKNTTKQQFFKDINNIFIKLSKKILHDDTVYFMDLKCGQHNEEPIRWQLDDIINGYQMIDGVKTTFISCLSMKSMIKIDVIKFIDHQYTEFSNIFSIRHRNNIKINEPDTSITLEDDIKKYHRKHQFLKCCKRLYSITGNPKLLDLFNGEAGILYLVMSNINTIILLLEKYDNQDIRKNIIGELTYMKTVTLKRISNPLENFKIENSNRMIVNLSKLSDRFNKIVNKPTVAFLKRHNISYDKYLK